MISNFSKLPSVLNHEEVAVEFRKIMDVAESNSDFTINEIADEIFEGLSALGYAPDDRFDEIIEYRIFSWIKTKWSIGDEDFVDGANTILCNLSHPSIAEFLHSKAQSDPREYARIYALEALHDMG